VELDGGQHHVLQPQERVERHLPTPGGVIRGGAMLCSGWGGISRGMHAGFPEEGGSTFPKSAKARESYLNSRRLGSRNTFSWLRNLPPLEFMPRSSHAAAVLWSAQTGIGL
jgi:hypothetical protein